MVVAFCSYFNKGKLKPISLPWESIGGLRPSKLKYGNLNISGKFVKISECQVPCANVKLPIENFLETVLV